MAKANPPPGPGRPPSGARPPGPPPPPFGADEGTEPSQPAVRALDVPAASPSVEVAPSMLEPAVSSPTNPRASGPVAQAHGAPSPSGSVPPVGEAVLKPSRILRFRRSERLLHWSIALPFLVCLGSAAVLGAVFNPHPDRPYRDLVSWIHRVAGLCLIGLPPLALITHPREWRTHLANFRAGWLWSFSEIKWLMLVPLSALSDGVKFPEEGRFNAAEKLNFMSTSLAYPLMGSTGLLIWDQGSALAPWMVHWVMACATLPLVGGHIYLAAFNPATRVGLTGMLSGWVDRKWAKQHHRAWYREQFLSGAYSAAHLPAIIPHRTHPFWKVGFALGWLGAAAGGAAFTFHDRIVPDVTRQADPAQVFLQVESGFWLRPVEDGTDVTGGPLMRGARLTRVYEAGPFTLVKDLEGRSGWVRAQLLGAAAPLLSPGFPFPDCHQRFGDADGLACQEHARNLLKDCKAACSEKQGPVCGELCGGRYDACVEGCRLPFGKRPQSTPASAESAPPPTADSAPQGFAATAEPKVEEPRKVEPEPSPKPDPRAKPAVTRKKRR